MSRGARSRELLTQLLPAAGKVLGLRHRWRGTRLLIDEPPLSFRPERLGQDLRARLQLQVVAERLLEATPAVHSAEAAAPPSWREVRGTVWLCWWRAAVRGLNLREVVEAVAVTVEEPPRVLPSLSEEEEARLLDALRPRGVGWPAPPALLWRATALMHEALAARLAPVAQEQRRAMAQRLATEREQVELYYYLTGRGLREAPARRGAAARTGELELLVRERDQLLQGLDARLAPTALRVECSPRLHLLLRLTRG